MRSFTECFEQLSALNGQECAEIAALVQALLARQAAGEAVAALEAQIDAAVYRLFGLGEEEIGVVERK